MSKYEESFIWVTTKITGFHKYNDAPTEVSFLRNTHRHLFHIRVAIQVFHNNREIEFFIFKQLVESILDDGDFDNKSCEMISDMLYVAINRKHSNRLIEIEVSEDGENGSFKRYNL